MGGVDEDGLISGLREEELITNEEMDQIVKEVSSDVFIFKTSCCTPSRSLANPHKGRQTCPCSNRSEGTLVLDVPQAHG
jgi:hypothetical protein